MSVTIENEIVLRPTNEISANPYQTRTSDDAEHIAKLADDIRMNGLLQIPIARFSPNANGPYIELAFGHSRLAAWKIAFPDQPFPVHLRTLTDRQMSDLAASENAQRKNLSAIETALAIKRRCGDFGLTQIEAAKVFGYTSQGSVSNLLRLLELPAPIQDKVNAGELSEGIARSLIPIARLDEDQAVKIAEHVTTFEPRLRADEVALKAETFFGKQGKPLDNVAWALDWPTQPIEMGLFLQGDESSKVPACTGCEFFISAKYRKYCARPECYALKAKVWSQFEAERLAKELKIKVLGDNETAEVLMNKESTLDAREVVTAAIELKHKSLRLMPLGIAKNSWECENVIGSGVVGLGTVDIDALIKALPKDVAQEFKATLDDEAEVRAEEAKPVDPKVKAEAERKQADKLAKARRDEDRKSVEISRLVRAAAKQLAPALPTNYLTDMLCKLANRYSDHRTDEKDVTKAPMRDKQLVVMLWLLQEAEDLESDRNETPDAIRDQISDLARALKVKFAKDWDNRDATPIEPHEFDCIDCGVTASTTWDSRGQAHAIRPDEFARNWSYETERNNLRCPECNAKHFEEVKARNTFGKGAKPAKSTGKRK